MRQWIAESFVRACAALALVVLAAYALSGFADAMNEEVVRSVTLGAAFAYLITALVLYARRPDDADRSGRDRGIRLRFERVGFGLGVAGLSLGLSDAFADEGWDLVIAVCFAAPIFEPRRSRPVGTRWTAAAPAR